MTAHVMPNNPMPRLGVGAFILNQQGMVLLLQRRREPEAGAWGLPGGKVDLFETCEAAVVREIKEELGVEITLEGLLLLVQDIDITSGRHWLAPVYRAQIAKGIPAIQEPDAHAAMQWFSPTALPAVLTVATQQAIQRLYGC